MGEIVGQPRCVERSPWGWVRSSDPVPHREVIPAWGRSVTGSTSVVALCLLDCRLEA